MKIIPVIDVLGGVAVAAFRGERADYRPLASPLAASAAPRDVVAGFLRLFPFEIIYIADLDAILARGDNGALIDALVADFRGVRFWVDAGARSMRALGAATAYVPVLGSETLTDAGALRAAAGGRGVLSLDFRGDDFLGPAAVLERADLWPDDVIVMTLARIGAGLGPDFGRLQDLRTRAENRRTFAAGGVAGAEDIAALRDAGAAGALVATALHRGALTGADLARLAE